MTRRDFLLVFIVGPALSVAALHMLAQTIDLRVGIEGLAFAAVPAVTGAIWGISRRPTLGRSLGIFVSVALVTVGLTYVSVIVWFWVASPL